MDMMGAIRKGLIEEIDRDEKLIEKELGESRKDLEKAERDLEVEDYKWSIVSA